MRIEDCSGLRGTGLDGYRTLKSGWHTFDACLVPQRGSWERLRTLRKALPNTKLQMLFRGQNILGYKHYADDVVEQFCKKSIENGIDVVRIFDALNDIRNLESAIRFTKKYGGICEPAISYTVSPVHNEDYFVNLAKELVQMVRIHLHQGHGEPLVPTTRIRAFAVEEGNQRSIHLHTQHYRHRDMVYLMAAQAAWTS